MDYFVALDALIEVAVFEINKVKQEVIEND